MNLTVPPYVHFMQDFISEMNEKQAADKFNCKDASFFFYGFRDREDYLLRTAGNWRTKLSFFGQFYIVEYNSASIDDFTLEIDLNDLSICVISRFFGNPLGEKASFECFERLTKKYFPVKQASKTFGL